jgi:hypothetical protein
MTQLDDVAEFSARGALGLKAELLSQGVAATDRFLQAYGPPFLEKRRAYGNPDSRTYRARRLPQELVLLPDRLVCAANFHDATPWLLDWQPTEGFTLHHHSDPTSRWPVDFPRRPAFYDLPMSDGRTVKNVITLYGGRSLGIFVYGTCELVRIGKACHYCSIQPNRSVTSDFAPIVSRDDLCEALGAALRDVRSPASQVMINGGNLPDPDKNFRYYASLALAAATTIHGAHADVEVHLIVYPPDDLSLIRLLEDAPVSIAMNCEVHDPARFGRFCPGKAAMDGHRHIRAALRVAVEVMGRGRVFSILVGGLEGADRLELGLRSLASDGVIPVVNIFHADPETPLATYCRPTADEILRFGSILQDVYSEHGFTRPFYAGCGRNSIDDEAHRRLFPPYRTLSAGCRR